MISKKIDCFEYGQLLFENYSTVLSNENVEDRIINTFNGNIEPDYFKENNITPRVFINEFLLRYYPNETSIKSTFINNVLLKSTNHVTVFELKVGNSRLDLCKINGISTAFEIKTELDTSVRLEHQMEDYFKTFEKVYLICSESNIDKMIDKIPKECGIYTYYSTKTGRYIFKKKRSAIKSSQISSYSQLSSLTKKDLQVYFKCKYDIDKDSMIEMIINSNTNKEINKIFKLCLKNKYLKKWEFLLENKSDILEIDYQWFYKNLLSPEIVYQ
ncbi:hypothetical protein SAMN04487943_11221 [Gracilibacillus orientalis]|uniref:Sce7726 family protein n=1 Tax=Gracilibacillus orientalis TaxID=334253 RepID=A0A1I4PLA5_9BACI|nr:sce7726 family protein [Gracilibacillus orientalis]SFM28537.1 hypothetical protein SAMN04487943_11221 [Gracilibacillus orientalis]